MGLFGDDVCRVLFPLYSIPYVRLGICFDLVVNVDVGATFTYIPIVVDMTLAMHRFQSCGWSDLFA